jgi:penicillin amidase
LAGDKLGREHAVQQQALPARQEERAVVQLDGVQAGFIKAVLGPQCVADLLGAGAQVITAVAELDQRGAAHHAGVGGPQAAIGNGGYDLGARAQQISDGLRAQQRFDEAGLHAIQLDHRALFLARWQRLLLDRVLTPEFVASQGLQAYRQHVEQSSDAARVDAVGYVLVREFRATLLELLFAPLAGQLEAQGHKFADLRLAPEVPGWALIRAGRPDTLPEAFASWQALLQAAVLRSRDALIARHGTLDQATWGRENPANVRHPLSAVLPPLARWLDMPQQGLAGDRHMPRVHAAGHGQSERMVVAPGHEEDGWLVLPGGQSGHPLSPFYAADHAAWVSGERVPFLPEATRHRLILRP